MRSPEGLFGLEKVERVNVMELTVTPLTREGCFPWWFHSNL